MHIYRRMILSVFFLKAGRLYQIELVYLPLLLLGAFAGIYTGGVNAGVSQHIRQTAEIMVGIVIDAGKEMSEVVRVDLTFLHPGMTAQL